MRVGQDLLDSLVLGEGDVRALRRRCTRPRRRRRRYDRRSDGACRRGRPRAPASLRRVGRAVAGHAGAQNADLAHGHPSPPSVPLRRHQSMVCRRPDSRSNRGCQPQRGEPGVRAHDQRNVVGTRWERAELDELGPSEEPPDASARSREAWWPARSDTLIGSLHVGVEHGDEAVRDVLHVHVVADLAPVRAGRRLSAQQRADHRGHQTLRVLVGPVEEEDPRPGDAEAAFASGAGIGPARAARACRRRRRCRARRASAPRCSSRSSSRTRSRTRRRPDACHPLGEAAHELEARPRPSRSSRAR